MSGVPPPAPAPAPPPEPPQAGDTPAPRAVRIARRTAAVARNTWFRAGFLAVTVVAAVVAVAADAQSFVDAGRQLGAGTLALAFLGTTINILAATMAWRTVLADLGSRLGFLHASRVFLAGQLGKYLPGSVWFLLAQMELAAELGVPRARGASASVVNLVLSVSTALVTTIALLPFAPSLLPADERWVLLLLPVLLLVLYPPVLNWALNRLMWAARLAPLEHRISAWGALAAVAWALLSWLAVGLHVFVLATAVGAEPSVPTLLLCIGGYSLAWAVGSLAVVAPAGAGAREIALGLVLAAVLSPGATLVVVIVSRVLQTLGDFSLAGLALVGANLHLRLTGPASETGGADGESGHGGADARGPDGGADDADARGADGGDAGGADGNGNGNADGSGVDGGGVDGGGAVRGDADGDGAAHSPARP